MTINVMLDGSAVSIDAAVFEELFEQSVVNDRVGVRRARARSEIKFRDLVELARVAEIPYPLFFAPMDVVAEQLRIKNQKLMAGFTKTCFSMNSRDRVHLPDIELIIRDLIRKQEYLKQDTTLVKNPIVGCLKRSRGSVAEDAEALMVALDVSRDQLRASPTKERALELLISKLEARQILVSRSVRNHMPQSMPKRAKFSGLTLKDSKVPYIFLSSGEGDGLEPAGRRVFTLTLLTVLIARGVFAPVTYDGHTKDETATREYELTAQVLMPAAEMRETSFRSLDDVRRASDHCKVTPSAIVMRARRLGLLDRDTAGGYLDELAEEFARRERVHRKSPRPVNAQKKYNGLECSRRMLRLLDSGHMNAAEFCRVMFANRLRPAQIYEFRMAVR